MASNGPVPITPFTSGTAVLSNPPPDRTERVEGRWAVLALFVLLAVVHTWPMAAAPGRLGRNSQPDTKLNQWTMAWVAHQVVRDPVHLFDANIFYPEPHTLAFSEHLLVQSIMVAPVQWAGASPVLAYNLAFLAGLALTGWATALVLRRWTGSWQAGIMSGSLMAFNALTLTRLSHIQIQHMEFFPLALLAFDRLLVTPRLKHALQLALWYVLQSLTSFYFLVFTAVALGVAALVRPREWIGSRARLSLMLLAAGVAIVALLPFLWPYLQARREQEMFVRTLPEIASFSAHITDYLATGGTIHNSTWSGQFYKADGLFPGLVGFGLALTAVGTKVAFTDRRARMALAFGIAGFLLSFGPAFPLYGLLYKLFPPMAAIRGAARWGQIFLAAVAILAGFGLVVVRRRIRQSWALPLCVALLVTANLEALRAPIQFSPDDEWGGVPEIFKTLNTAEPDVVVIFPFYPPNRIFMNARYMLVSTAFWKPMVNGYSGYMPTSYIAHTQNLGGFPDERSLRYLKDLGVTRVLVDSRNVDQPALARLPNFPELALLKTDGNLRIYELRR
jgi:hypothetical protein